MAKRARGKPKIKFGKADLPENVRNSNNSLSLKRLNRSKSLPVSKTEMEFCTQKAIEDRIMLAMKTIRALPDKDKKFQILKSAKIDVLQNYMDAYNSASAFAPRFIPSPENVSDCLVALSWVRHVDKKIWKIMWLRSFGYSFGLISKYAGKSDETVRRWYREGIIDAWATANGIRSPY